jgi:hypothetical protein
LGVGQRLCLPPHGERQGNAGGRRYRALSRRVGYRLRCDARSVVPGRAGHLLAGDVFFPRNPGRTH